MCFVSVEHYSYTKDNLETDTYLPLFTPTQPSSEVTEEEQALESTAQMSPPDSYLKFSLQVCLAQHLLDRVDSSAELQKQVREGTCATANLRLRGPLSLLGLVVLTSNRGGTQAGCGGAAPTLPRVRPSHDSTRGGV
ncbi:hypothetical protein LEMLEM_LOCUS25228 [Lemmus lemmus]